MLGERLLHSVSQKIATLLTKHGIENTYKRILVGYIMCFHSSRAFIFASRADPLGRRGHTETDLGAQVRHWKTGININVWTTSFVQLDATKP